MNSEKLALSAVDYVIFALTLLAFVAIGVYFRHASKKNNEEYLLAGRSMGVLPVAFSLMATFMSSTSIMGLPADIYLHGTNLAFMNIGFIFGSILSAYLFLPVYFNNNYRTAYEYLEHRFGKVVRRFVSAMFAVQMCLFASASLYAPALALNAVSNLSLWMSILTIGAVCTFYCTLGGLKAVLWTDVCQAVLMYTTLTTVIIMGCLRLGGIGNVFKIANDGGRLVFPSLKFDLTRHYSLYNIISQAMILVMSSLGGSQTSVQRLIAMKTRERSKMATYLFIPLLVAFQLLCCMCGLVFYSYFSSCDPMSAPNHPIQSPDQLMPYFIASTMSHLPGLPGLCIAGIFSAALSSVSSAVNSLAAITHEDFFQPLFPNMKRPIIYTQLFSLLYGVLCIGLSFTLSSLGSLMRMIFLVIGLFAGPNLAVFILATATNTANQEGVLIGLVSGLVAGLFFSFVPNRTRYPHLPLSNECPLLASANSSWTPTLHSHSTLSLDANLTTPPTTASHAEEEHFSLAYMWISTVGLLTCLIIGYFSSIIITFFGGTRTPPVHNIYLSPVSSRFSVEESEKRNSRYKNSRHSEMKLLI